MFRDVSVAVEVIGGGRTYHSDRGLSIVIRDDSSIKIVRPDVKQAVLLDTNIYYINLKRLSKAV